jgi:hypothetical protein
MARKKSEEIQKALGEFVKEKVEESIDEQMKDMIVDEKEQSINDIIKTVALTIPEGNTLYIKLYKKSPLPPEIEKHGLLYLDHINNVQDIDDLEIHVSELVRKNGWGTGIYQLRIYRSDKRGLAAQPLDLSIYAPDEENDESSFIHVPSQRGQSFDDNTLLDAIDKTATVAEKLASLTRNNPNQSTISQDNLISTLTNVLKTGIDVAKQNQPASAQTISPESMITAIVSALKTGMEMNKPSNGHSNLIETITVLKELGIINTEGKRDEKSLMEQLMELKAMGDSLGLFSGDGTSSMSPLNLLITNLAPRIPDMIQSISEPIKAIADLKKTQILTSAGIPKVSPPPSMVSQTMPDLPSTTPLEKTTMEANAQMNPILKNLYDAIQNNDVNYYPQIKELMKIYIGPHILPSLISKEITIDQFLNSLSTMLSQPFFLEDKTKQYFEQFIASCTHEYTPVIAKCNTCGSEYDFHNKQDFESDSKVCDCGGTLELINLEEGATTVASGNA